MTSERLYEFILSANFKNKVIILDNASSHRNDLIRNLINKNNILLYSVPYQHFTNAIENWFSQLKSYLYKENTESYNDILQAIPKALLRIHKDSYNNIIKGTYERTEPYVKNESRYLRPPKNIKSAFEIFLGVKIILINIL